LLPSYSRQPSYCIDEHCGNYIFIFFGLIELLLCVKLYVGLMRNTEMNVTEALHSLELRIGVVWERG
jgi:hypothetical protein